MWPPTYICDLLDSLDVAVCEFDAEHRAVRWNARFLEFFPEHASFIHPGEPYAENLRRFYTIRLDPSELTDIERYVTEGVTRHTQQQQPFEFTHHGRTVKVASLPLPDGGRVRMWREVRRPDAKLSSTIPAFDLLDHIPDGACVTDASNRIVIANAEFRRLYDVASDLVIVGQTLGQLETAPAVGSKAVVVPDLHDRGRGDADGLSHRANRPVRRLVGGRLKCQRHDLVDQRGLKRRDAWRPGLVAQQPVDPLGHEAFLPAPHAGLRLGCRRHHREGPKTLIGQQNDARAPDMLLRRTSRRNDRFKPTLFRSRDFDPDTGTHPAMSHTASVVGIPNRTLPSRSFH